VDAAIVEAAQAAPKSRSALARLPSFSTRGAQRYVREFSEAIAEATRLPESDLPTLGTVNDGPPPPRLWAEKDPAAADRLRRCREVVNAISDEVEVPQENLISPDSIRRLAWSPPDSVSVASVAAALSGLAARPWQIALVAERLATALAD
jgi:ribonuclease D